MAQTQRAGGPSEPDGGGGGMTETPEMWGNGGLVGDGRYRLTHRLGRGGMAEVFAAEDVRLGRTVAVKLLRSDLAEDPVSKARFTREAQSVAGLNHHAVVAVYDSGEDTVAGNVVPYIVMELVEGRTIRDLLLNAEAPPVDQALIIVSGVLEALSYSHHHGIVHRDIKPANVIITHGGAVKVMDFGIARALHGAQSTMTQTGMVMGTPQYLSPEQALGKTVDTRSDLYATGCLLYELLALRPPFVGETPLSVVYQHVQDNPVPPSQLSDSVPPELDGLVMRSLAKEPDDRFQSAEEMRGMVQYALRMLGERGAWTGTWDTGPVTHTGASTPAMGGAAIGGGALAHPGHSETSQIPAPLLGAPRGDDGGFDGGTRGNGNGGGGRGKMWLFMVLALIAVTVGVAIALQKANTGTDKDPNPKPTQSQSQEEKPTQTPTEEESSEDTGEEPGTGDTGDVTPSDGGTGDWTPSPTNSPSPSTSPTETGDGGGIGGPGGGEPDPSTPTETGDDGSGGPGGGNGGGDQPTNLPTGDDDGEE